MSVKPLPNCRGCIYLDQEGLCAYHRRAKISKAKLGVKTGKTGGCALYKGHRLNRGAGLPRTTTTVYGTSMTGASMTRRLPGSWGTAANRYMAGEPGTGCRPRANLARRIDRKF